ncbi:NUDIX domain-containing protein [Hymenobacter gummosus]|uniref:NUDIX domain-containing protein n=1 Tax=Hymenobacter gummosus TaxID=1776032 RepID=A0A3S0HB73_9BACT|nr:NUDIX hydrolase N-terminal domain-containing protein [Hymenobacter gummosus]RTQ52110.1 NUDIX domain-containing protein [Hymenobacter gummosus]
MTNLDWLRTAQQLQAIAQAGLTYSQNVYDTDRYEQLQAISIDILHRLTDEPVEKIGPLFTNEVGYQTPKVDVRVVLFRGTDEILMVQEKIDHNRWTVPGGWADIGLTPKEVAVKEAREETGLEVEAVRLLALYDKKLHPHPPEPWYAYKCYILCRIVGGSITSDTMETGEVRWVHESEIPGLELSPVRTTPGQLADMFRFARQPELPTICD